MQVFPDMIHTVRSLLIYICLMGNISYVLGQGIHQYDELDVVSYHVQIEPDIHKRSITGTTTINFRASGNTIALNSGNLIIDKVWGEGVRDFKKTDGQLVIRFSHLNDDSNQIVIDYHGNPTRGLLFEPEKVQAYTVFFTSEWMICNDQPHDKAKIKIDILVPNTSDCIASGELVNIEQRSGQTMYQWNQPFETPSYTYGFAIGKFNKVSQEHEGNILNYYAADLTKETLLEVFKETGSILNFFEKKSGVEYVQSSYSQVLIGDYYQEMSGFALLKDTYATFVLKDSSEIHLTSHELAHQWWGNMITCKSFSHFWLNEAFAVYMSSAYNEHRFGKEKYQSDISIYRKIYENLLEKGLDKPLVFPDWNNPSKEDRNIVYYKGAYVLHLLRSEIGDDAFWNGIKVYSQKFYGESVETKDFQQVMEESTGKTLDQFFKKWVY